MRSRSLVLLPLLIISLYTCLSVEAQSPKKALKSITADEISAHINYLASDELLGRSTPSAGLDSAANYIAGQFRSYGLHPVNGSYFNPVNLERSTLDYSCQVFNIMRNADTVKMEFKTDFIPFKNTGENVAVGNLVFAGYGITAPEYNYDDYAKIDANGKIVIVLQHEPGENDTNSVFNGDELSIYGQINTKVKNAANHGAVGLIVITDPLNHINLKPVGFAWPGVFNENINIQLPIQMAKAQNNKMPVIHAGKSFINLIFQSVDSLKSIQKQIDKSLQPESFDIADVSVSLNTPVKSFPVDARNVVAYLPGSDSVLKDELVIIGAHYDHVGYKKGATETDSIFNGADDNASGTATVLAVAKAFTMANAKPKRSVLFIAFTAEEIGLYGSRSYTQNPIFPLEKTVAMLNIDMVGRNSVDSLILEGAKESPDIAKIVRAQNKASGRKFFLTDGEYTPGSDHSPFYSKKIPFMFFFAGLHNDYHTERDNINLINTIKISMAAQLVFRTAWYIANDSKYYKIVEQDN